MAKDSDRLEIIMAELQDIKNRGSDFEFRRNILRAVENLVRAKTLKIVEERLEN
tara:strand:- start:218 stop:379 length:162 start_codon:yes stop_codon:yes gene_type:complete